MLYFAGAEGLGEGCIEEINVPVKDNANRFLFQKGNYSQLPSVFSLSGGTIYHLKQHFLPPATAWRFTKMK